MHGHVTTHLRGHLIAKALAEVRRTDVAAASPCAGTSTEPVGKREVRLVPEDSVGAGLDHSVDPIDHELAECRFHGTGHAAGLAIVEDLQLVEVAAHEIGECLAAKHLTYSP